MLNNLLNNVPIFMLILGAIAAYFLFHMYARVRLLEDQIHDQSTSHKEPDPPATQPEQPPDQPVAQLATNPTSTNKSTTRQFTMSKVDKDNESVDTAVRHMSDNNILPNESPASKVDTDNAPNEETEETEDTLVDPSKLNDNEYISGIVAAAEFQEVSDEDISSGFVSLSIDDSSDALTPIQENVDNDAETTDDVNEEDIVNEDIVNEDANESDNKGDDNDDNEVVNGDDNDDNGDDNDDNEVVNDDDNEDDDDDNEDDDDDNEDDDVVNEDDDVVNEDDDVVNEDDDVVNEDNGVVHDDDNKDVVNDDEGSILSKPTITLSLNKFPLKLPSNKPSNKSLRIRRVRTHAVSKKSDIEQ